MLRNLLPLTSTGARRTRYDEIPKYAEGLYDLGHGLYAWLVPNGSWGESNAGLITGDGQSLLVDTLWDVKYTRAMLDAMRPILESDPLAYVVNTHADGDHFWGNQLVAAVEIITSQASHDEQLTVRPKSMIMLGRLGKLLSAVRVMRADRVGHWFEQLVKPYDFQGVIHTPATRTFTGELTLTVGGREVRLIEVGPAHTRGDLLVYVPDARILYSGDILFIESTPVMWAGPVENWLAALERILALDVELIIPGHGPLIDKTGVRQVKDYWLFVAAELRRRYEAGLTAPAAARDLVLSTEFARQPFADWNSPERMMTNAHTIYRQLQGRTDHPRLPELLNIMRQQALLAHELPQGKPAVMRQS